MNLNKLYLFPAILFSLLAPSLVAAQSFDGLNIDEITIVTQRMEPAILRRQFEIEQNTPFNPAAYNAAVQELHDMRVFKKLEASLSPSPKGGVNIDINAHDSYYILPIPFYTSSNGKSAVALAVAEGNYFKRGEVATTFFAAGSDGAVGAFNLKEGKNSFLIQYTSLDFDQRFYSGGWSSNFGIFNTADDEEDPRFGAPLQTLKTERDLVSLAYSREIGKFTLMSAASYDYYSYSAATADGGNHNKITLGAHYRHGRRRQAVNMGALFGIGLSDKASALKPLPAPELSYNLAATYTRGGRLTGADYNISKLSMQADATLELKTRHMFYLGASAQDSFNSPFSDDVRSPDLLTGAGEYSRQLRGERGAGVGAVITYFLLRGNLGLLSVQPFYEIAFVRSGGEYRQHSGAGATLAYKFWRFPFPIGLNYTHNLADGSKQTGLSLGMAF